MIENLFKQPFVQQKLHHMLIKRAALLKAENMIFAPGITTCVDNGINAAEKIDISLVYTVSFHTSPVFEQIQIHIPRTLKNNKKGSPETSFRPHTIIVSHGKAKAISEKPEPGLFPNSGKYAKQ